LRFSLRRPNAEGVYYLQPRVARFSAATRGNRDKTDPNPERVANTFGAQTIFQNAIQHILALPSVTLSGLRFHFRSLPRVAALARVNPALEVVNAFGVMFMLNQSQVANASNAFRTNLRRPSHHLCDAPHKPEAVSTRRLVNVQASNDW